MTRRPTSVLAILLALAALTATAQEVGLDRPRMVLRERVQGMPTGATQEVRVLTATLKPGEKTPFHTHRFPVTVYVLEGAFTLGLCLLLVVAGISSGPTPAYLPELFEPRYRYTATGIGFNLAGALGGGVPIIVAPEILDAWGSTGVGIYLAGLAALSTVCLALLPETRQAAGSSAGQTWSPAAASAPDLASTAVSSR